MKLLNKVYTSSRLPQIVYPGQLWFDESINKLKIHDGTGFQPLDYFDYDISSPTDIDISQLTTEVVLAPKQRAFLQFTGNTIDLSKIVFENKGTDFYMINLTIFDETSIYSIEINHNFGTSVTTTTQFSGASMPSSVFLYNGDVAFRNHNHSKFERKSESRDKFVITPSSLGLQGPISSDIYIVYRGFSEKRSVHYHIYGNNNFIIGSIQALSNGNEWKSIGTINISSDSTISGNLLIYRLM